MHITRWVICILECHVFHDTQFLHWFRIWIANWSKYWAWLPSWYLRIFRILSFASLLFMPGSWDQGKTPQFPSSSPTRQRLSQDPTDTEWFQQTKGNLLGKWEEKKVLDMIQKSNIQCTFSRTISINLQNRVVFEAVAWFTQEIVSKCVTQILSSRLSGNNKWKNITSQKSIFVQKQANSFNSNSGIIIGNIMRRFHYMKGIFDGLTICIVWPWRSSFLLINEGN